MSLPAQHWQAQSQILVIHSHMCCWGSGSALLVSAFIANADIHVSVSRPGYEPCQAKFDSCRIITKLRASYPYLPFTNLVETLSLDACYQGHTVQLHLRRGKYWCPRIGIHWWEISQSGPLRRIDSRLKGRCHIQQLLQGNPLYTWKLGLIASLLLRSSRLSRHGDNSSRMSLVCICHEDH